MKSFPKCPIFDILWVCSHGLGVMGIVCEHMCGISVSIILFDIQMYLWTILSRGRNCKFL